MKYKGLMLVGKMEVLSDHASGGRLWKTNARSTTLLALTTRIIQHSVLQPSGDYYHGPRNVIFHI